MATITTKYSIGDTVYHAATTTEQRQHPCPDCNDSRRWIATSPAGDEFSFACPRCSTSYSSSDKMSLKYTAATPCVRRLTIGSFRHNSRPSQGQSANEYMCEETGVGSGSIYYEDSLFRTEEEALSAATVKAAHSNANTEWIATRFAATLEISDYQLSSAALKLAEDQEAKARSMLWNLNDLFGEMEEAGDKDEILTLVAEYRQRTWKRDLDNAADRVAA